jgi:general secretion pathway protein K
VNGARRQRGIALLIALLTVALAAVLIAGLLDRGELALARTRNALRGEQAEAYAQGLEAYAVRILIKDLEDTGDSNTDIWAMPLPPQMVPGGSIRASMRDLNGCFNLNNLASQRFAGTWSTMFARLLGVRGVDPSLLGAVNDWLGVSHNVDATDAYYLAQPVPYRSAQRVFAHVSELRLVRGVTSDVYARLAPYVCALPVDSKLNVNTASVPLLQTLGTNISPAQAESLWQGGQAHWEAGFKAQWASQGVVVDQAIGDPIVGVASSYFIARSDIELDGVPFTFFSVIQRGGGCGLCVVERSRGSDMAPAASAAPTAPVAMPR